MGTDCGVASLLCVVVFDVVFVVSMGLFVVTIVDFDAYVLRLNHRIVEL